MFAFRALVLLLLAAGLLSLGLYLATGKPVWRQRALLIVKWTVIASLGFFAVLLLERIVLLV